ncbi:phytanoyl-CoA dioxygenase family protein [Mycobacteroides abscessus 1948]|uniref:Phytanoyl-CoA dioxygenase family protein n=1 Tax=Mycobacteroides abscessus 1948 TaxID=1299323 RepID=A0A829QD90_9MYCO|nr:phytanoyl-CoA dioxygenase family protein [Mycobacteroides abscessus 1948]
MSAEVSSLVNLAGDLAGTYRWTPSSGDSVDPAVADADLAMLRRDGYVILPDLLTADDLIEIREAVVPLLDLHGRNRFEGHTTQRVYSVLNKTRACDRIADHPRVLALLDRLFLPNYLLSMLQVINILPGEQAQMLHTDDGFYPIPRPVPPSVRPPSGRLTISPRTTEPPISLRAATFGEIRHRKRLIEHLW